MRTASLFPLTGQVDDQGRLTVGGCEVSSLTERFGTPVYVFDETTLRTQCRNFQQSLRRQYPSQTRVTYAAKAGLNLALAELFFQEGIGLDVVSAGELHCGLSAGVPAETIHLNGSNKSLDELAMALDAGVGRVVVDNFDELRQLEGLAAQRCRRVSIWLRITPDVDVHTHAYRKTGVLDTKFGFPLANGDAERAVRIAVTSDWLEPVGLHTHIGSQIFESQPLAEACRRLILFAGRMQAETGFELRELSPGGGLAVAYVEDDPAPDLDAWLGAVCSAVIQTCRAEDLPPPELILEPGRSLIARAGVALYTAGARKYIPGVRTYLSVDGGMTDNIRPALYGARYTVVAATKMLAPDEEVVTVTGRACESGDWLARDVALPRVQAGDLLAVPMAGAYCLSMASNYNMTPRPAVVLVRDGQARLIQRRESLQDMLARDLPLIGDVDGPANR